ncbi:uncharacterized protein LOC144439050 [Glandiceps talaboti]
MTTVTTPESTTSPESATTTRLENTTITKSESTTINRKSTPANIPVSQSSKSSEISTNSRGVKLPTESFEASDGVPSKKEDTFHTKGIQISQVSTFRPPLTTTLQYKTSLHKQTNFKPSEGVDTEVPSVPLSTKGFDVVTTEKDKVVESVSKTSTDYEAKTPKGTSGKLWKVVKSTLSPATKAVHAGRQTADGALSGLAFLILVVVITFILLVAAIIIVYFTYQEWKNRH